MLVQLIRRDVAVRKDLAATQAAPVGRTVPVITARGQTVFYLVNVDGDWKVDFDQTRMIAPSGLTTLQIDQTLTRADMLEGVTQDILAGKFKTYAQVVAKLEDLDRSFPVHLAA